MGKLLSFKPQPRPLHLSADMIIRTPGKSCDHQRARAVALINRAAIILSELDEDDARVAWLLEDCADLLSDSRLAKLETLLSQ